MPSESMPIKSKLLVALDFLCWVIFIAVNLNVCSALTSKFEKRVSALEDSFISVEKQIQCLRSKE